jgi:pyridoxal phosphate enzyme (YggS family)
MLAMSVKENYERIVERIGKACIRSKRDPNEVKILAVCKNQPIERIIEAKELGLNLFGENKTQEAEEHMGHIDSDGIEWHFIGKLQKNKINKILNSFDFIESVDSVKSIEHIHKRVDKITETFIEINIADEKNKSGFTIEGLKKALNYISLLNRVKIVGLMCIPPFNDDPEFSRSYFTELKDLKNDINSMNLKNFDIRELSMGMSNDYEVAVEEGSTIVRIGTALFGRRFK